MRITGLFLLRLWAFHALAAGMTATALAQEEREPARGLIVDAATGQEIPRLMGTGTPISHALVSIDWELVDKQTGARRSFTEVRPVDGRFLIAPSPAPFDAPEGWAVASHRDATVSILMGGWSHPAVPWRGGNVTFAMRKLPETRDAMRAQLGAWRKRIDASLAGEDAESLRSQRVLLWYMHWHCARFTFDVRQGVCFDPDSAAGRYAAKLTTRDVYPPPRQVVATPPSHPGINLSQAAGAPIYSGPTPEQHRAQQAWAQQHVPGRVEQGVRGSYSVRRASGRSDSVGVETKVSAQRDLRFVPDAVTATFPSWREPPVDAAEAAGRRRDAAALRRMVVAADAEAIGRFGRGMSLIGVYYLPADIEAVVIQHFNNAEVGGALRRLGEKYQTRQLFELYLQRARAAIRPDDESFSRLTATDLPGIEEDLLGLIGKLSSGAPYYYVVFAGQRGHPGAIAPLLASLEPFYAEADRGRRYNQTLLTLLGYGSEDVWRQARAEIERLQAKGVVDAEIAKRDLAAVDAKLADPAPALRDIEQARAYGELMRRARRDNLPWGELRELRTRDPRGYARTERALIERYQRDADELGVERARAEIAGRWFVLGNHIRFELNDGAGAVETLTHAAQLGHPLAAIALGDLYQMDMNEPKLAARWYRAALAEQEARPPPDASQDYGPQGRPANAWWRVWLRHEIDFVESGRRFDGEVDPGALVATFIALRGVLPQLQHVFSPSGSTIVEPRLPTVAAGTAWNVEGPLPRETYGPVMQPLPASRLSLAWGLRDISRLQDPEEILREFARHDPNGFWTTCILAAVAYYDSRGEAGRSEAAALRASQMLPGWRLGEAGPISVAAQRFLKQRGIVVSPEPHTP